MWHVTSQMDINVMNHPCMDLGDGMRQLQKMAQEYWQSEEAQEEAETQLRIAALVSNPTLPWETSAGRGQQMARGGPLSRCKQDTWRVMWLPQPVQIMVSRWTYLPSTVGRIQANKISHGVLWHNDGLVLGSGYWTSCGGLGTGMRLMPRVHIMGSRLTH